MSDTEDSAPESAPEPAPEPVNAEPDPGEVPLETITANDDPDPGPITLEDISETAGEPDPGPITLEEEWRGGHGHGIKHDE